jgi:hypothetical protein
MSKRGRPKSDNKRQYLNTPIPITDNPEEHAVVQWWEQLSPDERLSVILATAAQHPPKPKPRLQYARCRIPIPDDPAQRVLVERFHKLKPAQRLAKLRALKESL